MTLLINALKAQITAQEERLEAEMLWSPGVFLDDADAFDVAHDAGFDLAVGSGSAGDRAIVPSVNRLGGKYPILHDQGTATVTMSAADGALDRIDLVGVQVRDDDFDASGFDDVTFISVEGVPDAVPVAPADPAGFLRLATVFRDAAEGAVTPGNISDTRVAVTGNPVVPGFEQRVTGRDTTSGFQDIATTDTIIATVIISIPDYWNTYDVEMIWSMRTQQNGAAGAADLRVEAENAGAPISFQFTDLSTDIDRTFEPIAGVAFQENRFITGDVTFTLNAFLSAESNLYRAASTVLIVHCIRRT